MHGLETVFGQLILVSDHCHLVKITNGSNHKVCPTVDQLFACLTTHSTGSAGDDYDLLIAKSLSLQDTLHGMESRHFDLAEKAERGASSGQRDEGDESEGDHGCARGRTMRRWLASGKQKHVNLMMDGC